MANIRNKLGFYWRIFYKYKYQDLIAEYLENIPDINADVSEKHRTLLPKIRPQFSAIGSTES